MNPPREGDDRPYRAWLDRDKDAIEMTAVWGFPEGRCLCVRVTQENHESQALLTEQQAAEMIQFLQEWLANP